MDKKQNYYSRQGTNNNSKTVVCEPRKSSDLFTNNKPLPRTNGKRRENPNSTNFKNDNNNYSRNSNNYGPSKIRTNFDKRPKARNYNGTSSSSATFALPINLSSSSITSTGLIQQQQIHTESDQKKNRHNDDDDADLIELNSVYTPGSKKQNLNHLLNFHYNSRENPNFGNGGNGGLNVFGRHGYQRNYVKKHKYNKEQFLQANFQFVIKLNAKSMIDCSNPDTLVEWSLIEQINIQTIEEPQCPICLYPPISAKLTRCGHVYCWPCILHYLALSDKTWRKCPICYEAIHLNDLKSTSIVQQQHFKVNDYLTLQLMRRQKGSMFIEKLTSNSMDNSQKTTSWNDFIPNLSDSIDKKLFSKFLLANSRDILLILEKERQELMLGNEDLDSPESVFICQALELIKERKLLIAKEMNIQYEDLDEIIQVESTASKIDANITDAGNKSENHLDNSNFEEKFYVVPSITNEEFNETGGGGGGSGGSNGGGAIQKDNKYYYFYQSIDGQNIFLHPLNVKMLQAMYGSLAQSPTIISSKIIQKESQSMNDEHRNKFTCLGHLPLTCQFEIIEIQLNPPIISNNILAMFKDDILLRQKTRQRRAREEKKREKEIDEINERQMGKFISRSAGIDIKSSQQFPTCGFEESLTGSNNNSSFTESINSGNDNEILTAVEELPTITTSNKFASFANILSSPKKKEICWPSLEYKNDDNSMTGASGGGSSSSSVWSKENSKSILVSKKSNTTTTTVTTTTNTNKYIDIDDDDNEIITVLHVTKNTLSDVLTEAFEKKKKTRTADGKAENYNSSSVTNTPTTSSGGNNNINNGDRDTKKNKKTKKTLLFSSGMNFNRN